MLPAKIGTLQPHQGLSTDCAKSEMNPHKALFAAMLIVFTGSAFAANEIRMAAPIVESPGTWIAAPPLLGDLVDSSDYYGCASALPATDYYYQGVAFEQTHSGCSKDQTQTVQPRQVNTKTGDFRDQGPETSQVVTETGQSYVTNEVGTSNIYSIAMAAGKYTTDAGITTVGMYARTNTGADIGKKIYTPEGDRALLYFIEPAPTDPNPVCYARLAATGPNGWEPGRTITQTSVAFMNKSTVLHLYNDAGVMFRTYTLSSVTQVDGGAYRDSVADCSDMNAFYNDLGYISKGTVEQ